MELKYRYYKESLIKLHRLGYSPVQMEKEIPVKRSTIKLWNNRLNLPINKFNKDIHNKYHSINFTIDDFTNAYNISSSDIEIANILKISRREVCKVRKELNLPAKSKKGRSIPSEKIILDSFAESAFVGCLLGDTHLNKANNNNTKGTIAHSVKQSEYIKHKHKLFKDISSVNLSTCEYTANRKTKHEGLRFNFLSNPYLNKFYDIVYVNKQKTISKELLDYYDNVSLAYHFMDDGTKSKNGYVFCTYGFDIDSVNKLNSLFRNKFNLKTSIRKDRTIYIKKQSIKTFNELVSDFIIDSMKYKLH